MEEERPLRRQPEELGNRARDPEMKLFHRVTKKFRPSESSSQRVLRRPCDILTVLARAGLEASIRVRWMLRLVDPYEEREARLLLHFRTGAAHGGHVTGERFQHDVFPEPLAPRIAQCSPAYPVQLIPSSMRRPRDGSTGS
jgi:hypothetical protein